MDFELLEQECLEDLSKTDDWDAFANDNSAKCDTIREQLNELMEEFGNVRKKLGSISSSESGQISMGADWDASSSDWSLCSGESGVSVASYHDAPQKVESSECLTKQETANKKKLSEKKPTKSKEQQSQSLFVKAWVLISICIMWVKSMIGFSTKSDKMKRQ